MHEQSRALVGYGQRNSETGKMVFTVHKATSHPGVRNKDVFSDSPRGRVVGETEEWQLLSQFNTEVERADGEFEGVEESDVSPQIDQRAADEMEVSEDPAAVGVSIGEIFTDVAELPMIEAIYLRMPDGSVKAYRVHGLWFPTELEAEFNADEGEGFAHSPTGLWYKPGWTDKGEIIDPLHGEISDEDSPQSRLLLTWVEMDRRLTKACGGSQAIADDPSVFDRELANRLRREYVIEVFELFAASPEAHICRSSVPANLEPIAATYPDAFSVEQPAGRR